MEVEKNAWQALTSFFKPFFLKDYHVVFLPPPSRRSILQGALEGLIVQRIHQVT